MMGGSRQSGLTAVLVSVRAREPKEAMPRLATITPF